MEVSEPDACASRTVSNDVEEFGLVNCLGTGRGHEDAVRAQQLERRNIEPLIRTGGCFLIPATGRKAGWIEDDEIVSLVLLSHVTEPIQRVGGLSAHSIRYTIALRILNGPLHCGSTRVDHVYVPGTGDGSVQSKPSFGTEYIENVSIVSEGAGCDTVGSLVDKKSGFRTVEYIHIKENTRFLDLYRTGIIPPENACLLFELVFTSKRIIVSLDDGVRFEDVLEDVQNGFPELLHSPGEARPRKDAACISRRAVAVDNRPRQPVALAENQSGVRCIGESTFTQFDRA